MLGDSEYGLITDNSKEALYLGIRRMVTEPGSLEHKRKKHERGGKSFSMENTVQAVEIMLNAL